MNFLTHCKHFPPNRYHLGPRVLTQSHSTSSRARGLFLDYFKSADHEIIPSSSVLPPPHDKSLSFTNAGMNQFKSVFQGETRAAYRRAANSQKCVRVGGKHNDLSLVGKERTQTLTLLLTTSSLFSRSGQHSPHHVRDVGLLVLRRLLEG